ncbi:alkaline phosphatase [Pseudomonas aeruginosa]|nr:alkaline phosphatase [Pseudomonas aeruginosa]
MVENLDELKAVRCANQKQPLIGLPRRNMPVRWLGPTATYHGNLNQPAVSCEANPKRNRRHPDPGANDQQGHRAAEGQSERLLPEVEGASIDKQDHAANPCGQIGETVDLDEAGRGPGLAKADGETLVIVTADHASLQPDHPAGNRRAGADPTAHDQGRRAAGDQLRQLRGRLPEHTGTQLRIAAYSPRSPMSPA